MKDISNTPGIIDLFTEAKWLLYCIHCDTIPEWKKNYETLSKVKFGFLDLKYHQVKQYDETVEIFCRFYYHERLPCNAKTIANADQITEGVGFSKKTRKNIYYLRNTGRFTVQDPGSRFFEALQPDVRTFINANRTRLSEWFY